MSSKVQVKHHIFMQFAETAEKLLKTHVFSNTSSD